MVFWVRTHCSVIWMTPVCVGESQKFLPEKKLDQVCIIHVQSQFTNALSWRERKPRVWSKGLPVDLRKTNGLEDFWCQIWTLISQGAIVAELGGQNSTLGIFRVAFFNRRAWKTIQRNAHPQAFLCKIMQFREKLETANFWEFYTMN